MSINDIGPQLEAARQEVAAAFGEKSGEQYGQYLFLMRLLARRGLAPQLILDTDRSTSIREALASKVFPRARFEVFEAPAETPQCQLDDFILQNSLAQPDILLLLDDPDAVPGILDGARQTLSKVAAVLCKCRLVRDPGNDSPLWIDVANLLADYDMHLFDIGRFDRNISDQRIVSMEMLFMRRENPVISRRKHKTIGCRLRNFFKKLTR